ncbi:glutathione S-transferase [Stenotrophomonas sp. Marseille-Q4652]|uniref:glutathione S-transferase family protein n=1 Tax=Stenotrophomonas sp. Marseille-Q4652 TaxID=2866595 RepID=UPI001CE49C98|nr:glutathione S-transferase [Stenotrophomonas sp. Marseille-Q4652]
MVAPVLHAHPLSSCCQKVLIAAHALGVELEQRMLDFSDATQRAAFLALSPMGKMPLLEDAGRVVAETSIIIEYLQLHHAAGDARLIPQETDAALQVRFWDRFCDFYVMTPMQALTAERLRAPDSRSVDASAAATATLLKAYGVLDRQLRRRPGLRAGTSVSPTARRHRPCSMRWPTFRSPPRCRIWPRTSTV